ncbi:hypothetical protein Tco_0711766, partial [Tanacetum coccineum]
MILSKKTRFQTKDHNDSLIAQMDKKYIENADLKAQIQEKFAKPDHVIASSKSRISSKNMPRFSSNDMVHHYLEEAKKKTQEKDRNSKSSVMHSTRLQNTTNGSKPKPRINNQTTRSFPVSKSSCVTSNVVPLVDHSRNSSPFLDSKHFVCSTCHKCVFNANHDACITKHSRRNHILRANLVGRSLQDIHFLPIRLPLCMRKRLLDLVLGGNPTGRILKSVGLRWIPTGKLFDFCTGKVDCEPSRGPNVDISFIHECKQTLDLSACTSINVQKKQSIDLSAVGKSIRSFVRRIIQMEKIKLFQSCSAATTPDASDKRQQQLDPTSSTSTLATTITADGNFD